jgi:hypothetical protein
VADIDARSGRALMQGTKTLMRRTSPMMRESIVKDAPMVRGSGADPRTAATGAAIVALPGTWLVLFAGAERSGAHPPMAQHAVTRTTVLMSMESRYRRPTKPVMGRSIL